MTEKIPKRDCWYCGAEFQPRSANSLQMYCQRSHRQREYERRKGLRSFARPDNPKYLGDSRADR